MFRTAILVALIAAPAMSAPADAKLAETVGADKYVMKPAPVQALLEELGPFVER